MRLTDDRYATERSQFELAMRMILLEARTGTIRDCTGLSDDRIRKTFATYFRGRGIRLRRRRGKSPQQVALFVKNPVNQLQAGTLVALYCSNLLLRIDKQRQVRACWPRPDVEFGHRLCRAYETYRILHAQPALSFEWAVNLLQNISRNDELKLAKCRRCESFYVQDAYALDSGNCPSCAIESKPKGRRRRAH